MKRPRTGTGIAYSVVEWRAGRRILCSSGDSEQRTGNEQDEVRMRDRLRPDGRDLGTLWDEAETADPRMGLADRALILDELSARIANQ
jgi:hypothetical protein